jgi:hypothetical protein
MYVCLTRHAIDRWAERHEGDRRLDYEAARAGLRAFVDRHVTEQHARLAHELGKLRLVKDGVVLVIKRDIGDDVSVVTVTRHAPNVRCGPRIGMTRKEIARRARRSVRGCRS